MDKRIKDNCEALKLVAEWIRDPGVDVDEQTARFNDFWDTVTANNPRLAKIDPRKQTTPQESE